MLRYLLGFKSTVDNFTCVLATTCFRPLCVLLNEQIQNFQYTTSKLIEKWSQMRGGLRKGTFLNNKHTKKEREIVHWL